MDFLTLVILTKSYKNTALCVAGKEVFKRKDWQGVEGDWEAGSWIRLVTSDQNTRGAIQKSQLSYGRGKYVELLDIVKVQTLGPKPTQAQPENHLIPGQSIWEKVGNWEKSKLNKLLDYPDNIWLDPENYRKDVISPDFFLKNSNESLYLIEPERLWIRLGYYTDAFTSRPRKEIRAAFKYNGENYRFSITDPRVRTKYDNEYPNINTGTKSVELPNHKLCISIGDLFEETQKHYKLVASIPEFNILSEINL